jgi:hypothetical protein
MRDVSFDPALTYVNCRYNMITDLRTMASPNLMMIAIHPNF